MKKTLRAFAPRVCIVIGVASSGCAQVLGIDGWTEGGAGGQGGEQSTSSGSGGPSGSTGGQGPASATAASTGSGTCQMNGLPCQDPLECCSQICENQLCAGCIPLGQTCGADDCCPDLVCGPSSQCCLPTGKACNSPADCCSLACVGDICSTTCTDEGQPCTTVDECCTPLVCQGNTCIAPCASQGQPCTLASQCCTGLTCAGGMCIGGCTAAWQPCSTSSECCPGLTCPSGICTLNNLNQMESEANNSQITADMVYPGKVCGSITPMGDHDWFAISFPGGQNLDATVVAGADICGPAGGIDSEVEIRSSTAQLAFNDDIDTMANYCSSASTTISAAGVYYVRVSASQQFAPSYTFSYCLTLTVFK